MRTTIPCPIHYWAQKTPANAAVLTSTGTYSYEFLDNKITAVEKTLRESGLTVGMRVGLSSVNSLPLITVLAALWRIGAIAVPLNFRLPATVQTVIEEKLKVHTTLSCEEVFFNSNWFCSAVPSIIHLENDATIIQTSGSTGVEKSVLHCYANHYYNALGSNRNIPLKSGDRWLLTLPLFHVGGLGILFRTFLAGTTLVIPAPGEPLEESVPRHGITHVSLVSTQLYRLLESSREQKKFSTLKAMLLGGSAFSESFLRGALEFRLPIHTSYGMSEMSSQVTTTPAGATLAQLVTSGRRLAYRRIKIDEMGEILVTGRTRFRGYVEGLDLVQPFDQRGWFATGDLGEIDADGYLYVLGRKDNVFISGGENIMPEEIEHVLSQIDGISQAVVVPVVEKEYGFRPVAFLKMTNERERLLVREEVLEWLGKKLPRYKVPDRFYLWPSAGEEGLLKIKRAFFKQLVLRPEELRVLFHK